jgi:hypothetical protein
MDAHGQGKHAPIDDPTRCRLEKLGIYFRMAAKQEFLHLDHRLLGVAPGAVGIEFRGKVGLKDRFQHQHRCRRADPIPQGRAAKDRGSLWSGKRFYFLWFGVVGVFNLLLFERQAAGVLSAGEAALINLLVAVVTRNEQFVVALHRMAVSSPLSGRRSKYAVNCIVHQLGGAHASAALCTIAWLSAASAIALGAHGATAAGTLALATLVLLVAMAITASPAIRYARHELFERVHRYGGWLALGLAFSSTIATHLTLDPTPLDAVVALARDLSFELLVVIAVLVLLPWLMLQTFGELGAEVFAGKLVKLTFPGRASPGTFARISFDAIEWHSFSVALHDPLAYRGRGSISLLVAAAGDWTSGLAERVVAGRAPERICVRRVKPPGFMHSVKAYGRSVVLATGGGIAPVLPYITGGLAQIFVIWIAPDPDATFGEIARLVRHHADARIYDTRCFGRPDTARLAIDAARAFDAEAVFCVSNPTGTRTVVNACLAEGIPAFGATWDS